MAVQQHIDAAITETDRIRSGQDAGEMDPSGARELAIAKTKLEEASMWLQQAQRVAGHDGEL